jgi:hypothetical protein
MQYICDKDTLVTLVLDAVGMQVFFDNAAAAIKKLDSIVYSLH